CIHNNFCIERNQPNHGLLLFLIKQIDKKLPDIPYKIERNKIADPSKNNQAHQDPLQIIIKLKIGILQVAGHSGKTSVAISRNRMENREKYRMLYIQMFYRIINKDRSHNLYQYRKNDNTHSSLHDITQLIIA